MDKRTLLDKVAQSGEERLLLGHVWDKYDRCRVKNLPSATAFLSPQEQQAARRLLQAMGVSAGFVFDGGYEGAERCRLHFLPDWAWEAEEGSVRVLRCTWYRGESPTHRDFLGSLMGLGLTRDTIGDILVSEESADVLVTDTVADFLLTSWSAAGRIHLQLSEVLPSQVHIPVAKTKLVRDTVPSLHGAGHRAVAAAGQHRGIGLCSQPRQGGGGYRRRAGAAELDNVPEGGPHRGRRRYHQPARSWQMCAGERRQRNEKGSHFCDRQAIFVRCTMEQSRIDRINELARKTKSVGLTDEEKAERDVLRREYVDAVLGSLRGQLDNTWVVDEQGNKRKLTDKEGAQK